MPTALVTGASRGIGRTITDRLVAEGWHVVAGVRSQADADALRAPSVTPVLLDVTDQAQIDALPGAIDGPLHAVVNNAGIAEAGPLEPMRPERLRRQFEVNVVGLVGVTSAVIPKLRETRGRIVLIGSVSGRVATPGLGAYGASKFAVEALADAWRVELRPWGIRTALIEPGSIDTDIWREAQHTADAVEAEMSDEHRRMYKPQLDATRKLAELVKGRTSPPEKVADAVLKALTDSRPRARYLLGPDARLQLAQRTLLPTAVHDAVMAKLLGAVRKAPV